MLCYGFSLMYRMEFVLLRNVKFGLDSLGGRIYLTQDPRLYYPSTTAGYS